MNHKLYIFTVVYRQDAVWNRSPVRTYRRWSRAGFHARAHYLINS